MRTMFTNLLGLSASQATTDTMEDAQNSMSMPGVIYLASWPRSGNTLLRAILWQCFGLESCSTNSEAPMYARNPSWHKLTGAVPFPNRMKDIQEIIDRQGVCFFKMHATPKELADTPEDRAIDDETRTIYLIRDGREACVSYWHYYRDILEDDSMTLERIIRGDCLFGSWSEHVRAWKPTMRVNRLKRLYMRYEDLLPVGNNLGSCRNVSWTLLRYLERFVRRTYTQAAIPHWDEFQQSDPQFFRSATNETWKTEMTGNNLALFDELHGDTMREYGYYPAQEPAYA